MNFRILYIINYLMVEVLLSTVQTIHGRLRFAGRSAICHTHIFCISYTRISIQFASGFPATVECLFELYLGVVVNYAMTSIFVGWST